MLSKNIFLCWGLFALLLVSCRRPDFVSFQSPAPLIDGFSSYTTVSVVETTLKAQGKTWTSATDPSSPPSQPPYKIVTLTLPAQSYWGHTGTLTLEFFNDRLYSTEFFPDQPDSFRLALEQTIGKPLSREPKISRSTRLRWLKDVKNREYAQWYDERLDEELNLWIAEHS